MPDDDAIKSLLERLCSLEEEQLAKLSEALESASAARERLEKVADGFKAKLEEAQKTQARKAAGYQIGAWLRTGFIVFMLGVIAIAIIVSHYLK
jgi:hypothetical protein